MDWSKYAKPFEGPKHRRPNPGTPDLQETLDVVSEKIGRAIFVGAQALADLGESYALIGGAAVGAHGAPRVTKDVDFLVGGDRVFKAHPGGFVTFREGVPIETNDRIRIDYLVPDGEHIVRALRDAPVSQGVRILAVEPLVVLKLRANRRQDRIDVGALVNQAGVVEANLADYLGRHEPDLLPLLKRALDEWAEEN